MNYPCAAGGLQRAWLLACLAGCLILTGCDEEDYYDHSIPEGMGSLVVDNNSGDDISIFIDGVRVAGVDGGGWEVFDVAPGLYRVVLDSDDYDRSYSGDVDVLQDRLTILDIMASLATSYYYYDVVTTYE